MNTPLVQVVLSVVQGGYYVEKFPENHMLTVTFVSIAAKFLRLRKKLYLLLFLFSKFLRDLCLFES